MGTEEDEAAGERYTNGLYRVLRAAEAGARRADARYVGTEHLLIGLTAPETTSGAILQSMTKGLANAAAVIDPPPVVLDLTDAGGDVRDALELSPRAVRIMRAADELARRLAHPFVGSGHVLLALAKDERSPGGERLAQLSLAYERLLGEVAVAYAHARRITGSPTPPGRRPPR
jgi:ATP-dependent Clp protease ATP-binding subunit ClpC